MTKIAEGKSRINVTVSNDVKEWLEGESKTTGIPQSTLILLALRTYIDQQKMMKMASQLDFLQTQINANNPINHS